MGWRRAGDNSLKFDAATEGLKIRDWLNYWVEVFWVELPADLIPAQSK